MSPNLPSSGSHPPEGLVVFHPPVVSLRQGRVVIDTRAVRKGMKKLPDGTGAVAFSSNSDASAPTQEVLRLMGELLKEGVAAVVCTRSVSEAVKVVEQGWVVGSLDRTNLVSIILPMLVDRSALAKLLAASDELLVDPIREIVSSGGSVRVVSGSP